MEKKSALITGIGGQDGSYLAEFLLSKGYKVVGTSHKIKKTQNPLIHVKQLNLESSSEIIEIVDTLKPTEIYNLAARSSSSNFFDDPVATAEINGMTTLRFLEAIKSFSPYSRFCQAASSEIFAGAIITPQDEATPHSPVNDYGASKVFASNMVSIYRDRYGLFASTAILFNHESPRRSIDYVTRKITYTVAKIAHGFSDKLIIGNLDSCRDWGFAGDYVRAMWMIMQHHNPEDFVIATGVTHSVRDICEIAFSHVGLDYRSFVHIDPNWTSRNDRAVLCGNYNKINKTLGWRPRVSFVDLIRMMVDADMLLIRSYSNLT
jgi:GDPmannose 4,6-dehydratase